MTTTPEEPSISPQGAAASAAGEGQLHESATPRAGDTQQVPPLGATQPLPPTGATQPPAPYTGPAHQAAYSAPAPYAGPAHPGQPAGQQPAAPYPYGPRPVAAPPAQPYAPPAQPYAGPTGPAYPGMQAPPPAGTTTPKRRAWLPIVATLLVVALLGAAAIAIGTHRFRAVAAGEPSQTSIATLGQSDAGAVPVAGSTNENPDWAAVAAAVQPAVVAIDVQMQGGEALGSGVVVDKEGHVVTNNHVVEGAQGGVVKVTLSDGRIYDAKVAGTDPSTDLAVVTIQDPPSDLAVAQFGNSDDVRVGDAVMAVGNPLGLANTVTTGIVSAVDRPVSPGSDGSANAPVSNAIQIDAAVNPGNSGGPLFDVQGHVIGITSSIATTSSQSGSIGLGFAIPVNLVKDIAEQLVSDGEAKHAYLGVSLQDGTATADGVTRRGAAVTQVSADSPAAAAGVEAGDVVVAINGKPVGGADALAAYVRALAADDKASLVLVRDGESLTLDVTLAARVDDSGSSPTAPGQPDGNRGNGSPDNKNRDNGSPDNGSPDNGNPDNGDGNSFGLPGGMTPDELWNWLQEHQDQLGNG